MSRDRMIYGVYEDDEIEMCVYVGTAKEIAIHFNVKENTIYDIVSDNKLFKWKYRIKRVGYESELERS